jgi:hypothetical protein
MTIHYASKTANAEPVLKLIARSPLGRELLESFLPLLRRGKVKIEPYPAAIVAKLREAIPEGQPIGACLITEGNQGTIFLDFESPIGVLAPFLVHEIVHSLEPKIWAGKTARSQTTLVETEVSAFQTQFRFTQELRERDPEYDSFLKENFPKAKLLNQLLEFDEIDALYTSKAA